MADGSAGAKSESSRTADVAQGGLHLIAWNQSKASLLRSIWRANNLNRVMRINDFNRRDIAYFAERGLIVMGERGPALTDQGLLKLCAQPTKPQHLANSALTHTTQPL